MTLIQENISLAPYTHLKVGGPARFFAEVKSQRELQEVVAWAAEQQIPVAVLGAGSNVLVSDAGFGGLVIRMRLNGISLEGDALRAGAGVSMAQAALFALEHNRSGFEWAVGIPGTIGGSVYGNAGCFGGEIKDVIESVKVFDIPRVTSYELRVTECKFAYRESIFKRNKDFIILGATLKLKRISDKEKKERQAWIKQMMRERVAEQAIGARTMGSTFKGIPITNETISLMQSHDARFQKGDTSCWMFENRARMLSAGFLIEQAGLKGKKIGGVSVSLKHANFLVNDGAATAEHVAMLIALLKERVHRKFGIMLEEEIQYLSTPFA